MIVIVVISIVAILAVMAFVAMRVFSISVDTKLEAVGDSGSENDADGEAGGAQSDSEGDGEPAEMVDLFDYFGENPEGGEGEGEGEGDAEANGSGTSDKAQKSSSGAATTDKLTDFFTGRKYLVACKNILETAKDDGHIYCAAYLDYDRFNYINSLKGNAMGDYVLTHTAQHIRRIFPDSAELTRISCDHFTALFPMVNQEMFEDIYEQLRRMCEKIRTDIAVKTNVKISVGFATTDIDSSYDINVLLARANVARHCVKVTKAEKFETFEPAMITSNFFGDTLMENYAECQYADDFTLYFETILDLSSDSVEGCDSLVRWTCEDAPGNLITTESGTIPTNNDKVIYHVCRALSRWRKAAREVVRVFVDVPVTLLFKSDLEEFIVKCLTEFQVDPHTLVLKVNVCLVRLDWSMCSKQFKRFHEIGVKICITGVDTGYSNFEFLTGLSVDFVKLHRSFAHGIESSPDQFDKCKKAAERISSVGARAIFEGVDTVDQVSAMLKSTLRLIQGRYTGRPSNVDDMSRILPEHVERRVSDQTVILDESQLAKGEWKLF